MRQQQVGTLQVFCNMLKAEVRKGPASEIIQRKHNNHRLISSSNNGTSNTEKEKRCEISIRERTGCIQCHRHLRSARAFFQDHQLLPQLSMSSPTAKDQLETKLNSPQNKINMVWKTSFYPKFKNLWLDFDKYLEHTNYNRNSGGISGRRESRALEH